MECNLYKATKENDTELKKKVYKEWKWKEQHDIEFDPDKVFCYGCKEEEKPKNLILQKCTVRPCAMGKKLDSCIQCSGLKDCDKELGSKFPDFKNHILSMQETYVTIGRNKLL